MPIALMRERNPNSWTSLRQTITRIQRDRITPGLGLRNAIGVALPLAIAAAKGAIPTGMALSTGALNVSFSDSSEPYVVRGGRMLGASVLVGFAVATGEMCANHHPVAVAITLLWAFAAGLLVALGNTAADLGTVSLVTLVVYGAAPATPEAALLAGLLAFAGGLFQTALSLALWPVRRYAPERRALGGLYLELRRLAGETIQPTAAPPGSSETTQARQSLMTLGRDQSVEGERLRALLSQAERIRLNLLMLGRLRTRIERESEGRPESSILSRYFEIAAQILGIVGEALTAGQSALTTPDAAAELRELAEALRQPKQERSPALTAMLRDARHQMDALTGQLRAALDLAAHSTPAGTLEFERHETRQPWTLRLIGTAATLRANLSLESAACRHAIRLAVCVGGGDALARGLGLSRSYWLPMTIAIVLKPDFNATFSRGILRLAGTFAGLLLATGLFELIPGDTTLEIIFIFTFMFLLRGFGGANYGIFVVAVTALVVLLFAVVGIPPTKVIAARGWNTALGGSIALIAYALWPTWERNQVPEAVARLLDSYRAYFHAVRQSYVDPAKPFKDYVRNSARLARSNLEASVERLMGEPGVSGQTLGMVSGILANSHRLVHAIMALEAGLTRSRAVPARPAFIPFSNAVELTLYYLAAHLRGSPLTRNDLPDLREAHHALIKSRDPLTERYTLVNIETDRVTNSLNTLAEELLRWMELSGKGP